LARMPRQWCINIVYTIASDPFEEWVTAQVEQRNAKVADKNKLELELDSEVAEAFRMST
jgi:ferric-dicitrate binding protein FerR (iron transport regulator)